MATSANGYEVLFDNGTDGALPRLRKWEIPESNTHVYLRDGSAGFILAWIATWWDENIRRIDIGIWDDWGHAVRPVRGQTSGYSNHASGTAIDVDATRHPRGVPVNRNLTPAQVDAIHDMLRYLDGVIRWGGDYNSTVDAMHFELNKPLGDAERLALKLADTKRGKAVLAANPGAWEVISSGTSAEGKPQPGTVVEPPKPPEPKPEPKPEVPPHDLFTVGLVPGKWDAPLKAWTDRHREARDKGAEYVGHTEGTQPKKVGQLQQALGLVNWGSYHDPTPGPANIIHTWDLDRYEQVGLPWKLRLEDDQTFTKRGVPHPDTYAVGVALRDKQVDEVLLMVGTHLPLENTANRRASKEEALATLKARAFREGSAQFPGAARILWADWNRPARKAGVREWFASTFPRLTPAWVTDGPNTIDWQAGGQGQLALIESRVLKRKKGDPLDHHTKVTRWGWK